MIFQNVSEDGRTDISFTMPKDDLARSKSVIEAVSAEIGGEGWSADSDIAKISLIGAGMRSHPGVAATMFRTLADAGINIEAISTSTIRISCVIRASEVERAIREVHSAFGLPAEAVARAEHA
jgi:aspartate kinase